MKKILVKRCLQIVIVLFGVSFITFSLMHLAPGDPATAMFEASGVIPTPKQIETVRASLGLDKPFLEQYTNWISNALHGDLGMSMARKVPVATLIAQRIVPTAQLALFSMILMVVVSIPLGIISAVKKDKITDNIITVLSFFGMSMPNFWVGLVLMYICCVKFKLLPLITSKFNFTTMLLPGITLAIAMSAKYIKQTRTAVLEELNQDYVTGARARGIPFRTILFRHVLPNVMLPLITLFGLSVGSLLAGTAIVEVVFSYPGLGSLGVMAATARDYQLTQGFVLYVALIYMVINLLVDISYSLVDPRIRRGGK